MAERVVGEPGRQRQVGDAVVLRPAWAKGAVADGRVATTPVAGVGGGGAGAQRLEGPGEREPGGHGGRALQESASIERGGHVVLVLHRLVSPVNVGNMVGADSTRRRLSGERRANGGRSERPRRTRQIGTNGTGGQPLAVSVATWTRSQRNTSASRGSMLTRRYSNGRVSPCTTMRVRLSSGSGWSTRYVWESPCTRRTGPSNEAVRAAMRSTTAC